MPDHGFASTGYGLPAGWLYSSLPPGVRWVRAAASPSNAQRDLLRRGERRQRDNPQAAKSPRAAIDRLGDVDVIGSDADWAAEGVDAGGAVVKDEGMAEGASA